MAAMQAHVHLSSSYGSVPSISCHQRSRASLQVPANLRIKGIGSLRKLQSMIAVEELSLRAQEKPSTMISNQPPSGVKFARDEDLVAKLYAIAEAAADRAEMHAIIGEQRNNWNVLLVNSINSINLAASIMAGISAIPMGVASPHLLAFKLSSAVLYAAATGVMMVVNKIQPSQLAEEQRNAARLFRELEKSIHTDLALRSPTKTAVEEAMERVLALDEAYPLPLLPGMLEKFPKKVEPTMWWPKQQHRQQRINGMAMSNGWSKDLEEEMRGVLRVIKTKDVDNYVTFAESLVKINKTLAVLGPLFAGLAAAGAGLIGTPALGPWPAVVGVLGGALATIVNTVEHGGQLGMVVELSRNCAGFYRQLEEKIESNLGERDAGKREDGELFELKTALQLGRSLSDLKNFAAYSSSSSSSKDEDVEEFAGKLF